jgi:hypothetical protein
MASWDIISILFGVLQLLVLCVVGLAWGTVKSMLKEFREFKDQVLKDHMTREQIERTFKSLEGTLQEDRKALTQMDVRLSVLERIGNVPRIS